MSGERAVDSSRLRKLSPFLDSRAELRWKVRVGGIDAPLAPGKPGPAVPPLRVNGT
jgi:hypothetical protein